MTMLRLLSLCVLALFVLPASGAEVELSGSSWISSGKTTRIDFTGRVGDCFTGTMSASGKGGWTSTFICPVRPLQKGESTAILKDKKVTITFLDGTFNELTVDPGGWLNSAYTDPKANTVSSAIFYRN